MNVLLTGGTGYIGSHTAIGMIARGMTPVIVDNLSNSDASMLDRIEKISGHRPPFYHGDVRDTALMTRVLRDHAVTGVVHFAALKSVSESVENPALYHDNNVGGLRSLLDAMDAAHIDTLVYSSSATGSRPGSPDPFDENAPLGPINPYGDTKAQGETIVKDWAAGFPKTRRCAILRYFNPVGAHPSGLIGEAPRGTPSNLMPYLCQVAAGLRPVLTIFGNDYPTPDGTAIRDYIHVCDLADAHLVVLEAMRPRAVSYTLNIGTGRGYSVADMVTRFEQVNHVPVPHQIGPRRAGDAAIVVANPDLIHRTLGWQARYTLDDMCRTAWAWQRVLDHTAPPA